jgi:FtsZ-binding cell division protein ZapB
VNNLRQFDKLQILVKEAADLLIRLKFENKKLREENEKLVKKLAQIENNENYQTTGEIEQLRAKNRALKQKHDLISSRLSAVLDRVQNLTGGVES